MWRCKTYTTTIVNRSVAMSQLNAVEVLSFLHASHISANVQPRQFCPACLVSYDEGQTKGIPSHAREKWYIKTGNASFSSPGRCKYITLKN